MLISISIFIVSFLALYVTLSYRAFAIRNNSISIQSDDRIFQSMSYFVDLIAFYIVMGLKYGARNTYLFLLVISHNAISLIKYLVVKVERRFIKLIDSVRGKGIVHKKGSASLFLREIKEYQDNLKRS